MSTLPSNIRLQVRSHIVVARAMSALQGIGLVQSAIQQSSSIAMILDNSIAQIDDVEAEFAPLEGFHNPRWKTGFGADLPWVRCPKTISLDLQFNFANHAFLRRY